MNTRVQSLLLTLWALIFMSTAGRVQAQIDVWHFDEGSGTTTADSAGSNPGTLMAWSALPQWVSGISSNALHFNGSYVVVSANAILSNLNGGGPVQQFTVEAWVKWDGTGAATQAIYCESAGSPAVELFLNSGVPSFFVNNVITSGGTVAGTSSLPAGQWHHLAGVLQTGGAGILYVDGQAIATNANMGTLFPPNGGETDIGRFASSSSTFFSGTIDEVQLFNTARGASQNLADYQTCAPPQVNIVDVELNLFTNGDFEAGNSGFTNGYAYSPAHNNTEGQYTVSSNPSSWNGFFANTPDHTSGTGMMLVVNGATSGAETVWAETVPVKTSTTYQFQSWVSSADAGGPAYLVVEINGVLIGSGMSAPNVTGTWVPFTRSWNSGSATNATVQIIDTSLSVYPNDFYMDDFSFSVEPIVPFLKLDIHTNLPSVKIYGRIGNTNMIEYASDLSASNNWTVMTNILLDSSPMLILDSSANNSAKRFYRAVQQ